jgi:hypothetical protein
VSEGREGGGGGGKQRDATQACSIRLPCLMSTLSPRQKGCQRQVHSNMRVHGKWTCGGGGAESEAGRWATRVRESGLG